MAISGVSAYLGYSYYGNTNSGNHSITSEKSNQAVSDQVKKTGKRSSPAECETCKNRKYQDGSDENVSFKTAQHVSPSASGAAVRSHEAEQKRLFQGGERKRTGDFCGSFYPDGSLPGMRQRLYGRRGNENRGKIF